MELLLHCLTKDGLPAETVAAESPFNRTTMKMRNIQQKQVDNFIAIASQASCSTYKFGEKVYFLLLKGKGFMYTSCLSFFCSMVLGLHG